MGASPKKGAQCGPKVASKDAQCYIIRFGPTGARGGSAFGRSPPLLPSKGRSYREFFGGPEQVLKLLQGAGPCGSHGQWPLEFQSFHISSWRREKARATRAGKKEGRKKEKGGVATSTNSWPQDEEPAQLFNHFAVWPLDIFG